VGLEFGAKWEKRAEKGTMKLVHTKTKDKDLPNFFSSHRVIGKEMAQVQSRCGAQQAAATGVLFGERSDVIHNAFVGRVQLVSLETVRGPHLHSKDIFFCKVSSSMQAMNEQRWSAAHKTAKRNPDT